MMPVLAALCAAAVLFISWQTEFSICFLLGTKSTYGCTYVVIAVCAVLLVIHEVKDPSWGRPWIKRIIGFVCCLFIYYAMLTAMWGLIGLLLNIDSMVIAVGTLIMAGVATLIVLLGCLYTKIIRKRVYSVKVGTTGAACRIALMSDIHLGAHVGVRYVQRIVRAVNELSADLVVIVEICLTKTMQFWKTAPHWKRSASRYMVSVQRMEYILLPAITTPRRQTNCFLHFWRTVISISCTITLQSFPTSISLAEAMRHTTPALH